MLCSCMVWYHMVSHGMIWFCICLFLFFVFLVCLFKAFVYLVFFFFFSLFVVRIFWVGLSWLNEAAILSLLLWRWIQMKKLVPRTSMSTELHKVLLTELTNVLKFSFTSPSPSAPIQRWKSVQNSTDEYFSPKNSTKNAYFATYFSLRQNSVNSPGINQVLEYLCFYRI